MFRIATIAAITLLLGGCPALECGDGTHEEGGTCVPNTLYKCGPGTVFEKGYCIIEGYDAKGADIPDSDEDRDGED